MSAPGDKQKAKESKTDWQTPPELFAKLDFLYGPFTVDGAASEANHLCPAWYSEENSAFDVRPSDEIIFVNPPYGNLLPWMKLFLRWRFDGNTVVALTPCAPDTEWWNHGVDYATDTIILGPGRVRFIDPETGKPGSSNTVASTVFFYDPTSRHDGNVSVWDWRKDVFGH